MRLVCFLILQASCWGHGTEAGVHLPLTIKTPLDYRGVADASRPVTRWSYALSHPGASYLALHFSSFALGPGDCLAVSDRNGVHQYDLTGLGKMQAGRFWAQHVNGDTVTLELIVSGPIGGRGFVLDEYVAGVPDFTASVHGPDDRANAICYAQSHPTEYQRGKAVVRLLTNGSGYCTGSLVSPYGHILTNNHCISTQDKALNTDFEFMAEAPTCDTANCPNCHPGVVFSGGTLVAHDAALDYALILLAEGEASSSYGFLDFDVRPPVLGEQIYIPQHAGGWAKEFAIHSSHPDDAGGVPRVQSVSRTPCAGGSHLDIGYYADTMPGASGSPILATASHRLLALHHCSGSMNSGIPVNLFYGSIQDHILGLRLFDRIAAGSISVGADTADSGCPPDHAIDRRISTYWASGPGPGPHWLMLDLGLEACVHGYKLWHASAAGTEPTSHNTRAFALEAAREADGPWTTEWVEDNTAQQPVSMFSYAAPKTCRYLRVQFTDPGGEGTARLCEFEVLAEDPMISGLPSGPNLAQGAAQVQASSTYGPQYGPEKAVDGILTTDSKWTSGDTPPPHHLTVDLGTAERVRGFVLRQPEAAGEPAFLNMKRFAFQSARSMNGPWFTESEVVNAGGAAYESRLFVVPKSLRYIRLWVADPGPDQIARVPEFEIIAHDGPVALFDAAPTDGPAPMEVVFADRSLGPIWSWAWDFGDGSVSGLQHPLHTYLRPGHYSVRLTVTGPEGSASHERAGAVRVSAVPADHDRDGDVDQEDFGFFQGCLSGLGIPPGPAACRSADLDGDSDVDTDDMTVFQACLGGPAGWTTRLPAP